MTGVLTMAWFRGNPNLWIVGQRVTVFGKAVLNEAFVFVNPGPNQVGLSHLPAGGKKCTIPLAECVFSYPVDDEAILELYIEVTTGIQSVHLPLASNVIPLGGAGPRVK